jgi:hypothetical protein
MPLPLRVRFALVVISAVIPVAALAQVPTARPPIIGRHAKAPRQEPCWQQAGISKGAMQQRKSIEQGSRAEIQSVCANGSLTPQQRREQIRAIHERTRQQVDGLISPQQREAMRACQEARGHGGGGGFHGGGGGRGEGPCGELNEPKEPPSERQP